MGQLARVVQLSVWIFLLCSTLGNSGVYNITYDGDTADAETLIKLGSQIKKPLLTLIGMAIRNQHSCSEWTQWSSCTAHRWRYFGTKKRTRTCGTHKTTLGYALSKLEEDISVCVGAVCPSDYNLTANGYCLKIYGGVHRKWNEADKLCRNDGGNLVYIDSDAKFSDVKKMLEGVRQHFWIDGRRNGTSFPWVTSNGDKMTKFYWMPGQPNNGPTDEVCIALDLETTRAWHDDFCISNHFGEVCETAAYS